MTPEIAAQLERLGIERVAGTEEYAVYARGVCVAMLHRGEPGSSGYLTEGGVAYLVWRAGEPWLVSKTSEAAARPEQVREIQEFSADLKQALAGS